MGLNKEILRYVKRIDRNVSFLKSAVPDEVKAEIAVRSNLKGTRLKQFLRVKELLRLHPDWAVYRAATVATKEIAGGYPSKDSLARYCMDHVEALGLKTTK